jgi:2-polyprenyl-3-methyl-5-hydroxy-6-metoxy-1,4-benzoquinol methylase
VNSGQKNIKTKVSDHYDSYYFNNQKKTGEISGWADHHKFKEVISSLDTVVDFGCGPGNLLSLLNCKRRIGIEPNESATSLISNLGIEHFSSTQEVLDSLGEGVADVIVSNHVLEHTLNPLQELINLRLLLKKNGVISFVVPCESINNKYFSSDVNKHLYTWSPINLGHLFKEAGYSNINAHAYLHKWPPFYKNIAKLGWPIFNTLSYIYGFFSRSVSQVRIVATR